MRISHVRKLLASGTFILSLTFASLTAAAQAAPPELTLRPGTMVSVRLTDWVSSDQNQPGDSFSAVLEQPLVADGWVVAYQGQPVMGRVAVAQKAGRIKGVSQLGIELGELTLADGQVVPIRTQLVQGSGGTTRGRDVAVVGGTTAVGAAIGAAAGGGPGAGIGAGAGAAAGLAGVLATRGRPTVIPAETLLIFRVVYPVTFSTARGQAAFQPVTPQTYDPAASTYGQQQRYVASGQSYAPPPAYYYSAPPVYPYPYAYGYSYYAPYYPHYYPRYYSYPHSTFIFGLHGSRGLGHGGYGRGFGSGHSRGFGGHGRGH